MKCKECGSVKDISYINKFGSSIATPLCQKCDSQYLREKKSFYKEMYSKGQSE